MKKKYSIACVLGLIIYVLDRFTKEYAFAHWQNEYYVNPFLFFQVTINRGISWGMLNDGHKGIFTLITLLISSITVALMVRSYRRSKEGKSVFAEICIIAGSLSNITDRIIYSGVVDFIAVHKNALTWPVFNIADCFIVLGVALLFIRLIRGHE